MTKIVEKHLKKQFKKINVEISNICNLQCSFCPEVLRTKKMMDVELFKKIVEQIQPLTELICFHLMGDPLVHPKLDELIAICADANLPIYFVSNGVLLKPETSQLLLNPIVQQVNFSLHSFFDNYPGKTSALYLQRIFDFTELAFKQRPDLFINYRLWNLDAPAGSHLQNRNMLESVQNYFQFEILDDYNLLAKKNFRIKNKLYMHFDTEFIWPSLELENLGDFGTCYGLSSHFGILVDGTVVPCCLDKEGLIPLGSIQEKNLTEILGSEKALNILNGFKKNKLVEQLCQRCNYIQRFSKSKQNSPDQSLVK